ncbi:MAG TPA: hypothetical protein VMD30_08000 [Tepidisphaeraceae bacterium]|nr:hypothetical protein [Tepidisphaeraceae bacterium]
MLSLLLDEHISPIIALQARRKYPGMRIVALREWRGGQFMGAPDPVFMQQAARERLTLVSYDLRTIAPLLKSWLEQGIDHGGVIFVDQKSIRPQDFGGLVRALGKIWKTARQSEWRNRVVFLRRRSEQI